jgi:alcohol dehydrogenase class IV
MLTVNSLPRIFFDFHTLKDNFAKVSIVIATNRGIKYVKQNYQDLFDIDTLFVLKDSGYPNESVLSEDIISLIKNINFGKDLNILVFGGGATLDYGKIITSRISLDLVKSKVLVNLLLVPSNSGSAAELTDFSTIWNYELSRKISFTISPLIKRFVYYDIAPLKTLTKQDFIIGLLDSISHAFDSKISNNKNSILSSLALMNFKEGVFLLSNLDSKLEHEQTIDFQLISLISGMCISTTKTSLSHALSYGLTLTYGYPHGMAVGIILKELIINFPDRLTGFFDKGLLTSFLQAYEKLSFDHFSELPKPKMDVNQLISQVDNTRLENSAIHLDDFQIRTLFQSTIKGLES